MYKLNDWVLIKNGICGIVVKIINNDYVKVKSGETNYIVNIKDLQHWFGVQ